MFYIQKVRTRKEPLISIRRDSLDDNSMTSNEDDIKIEIIDVSEDNFMEDQVIEVVTSPRDNTSSGSESMNDERPRKRARLDHLSMEQKAQHRKMMNRVSAQSARDRQKNLMVQQEETIKSLNITKDILVKENKRLKTLNIKLMEENALAKKEAEEKQHRLEKMVEELEKRLAENVKVKNVALVENSEKVCTSPTSEPAALLKYPLPKGPDFQQTLTLILLMWTFSTWTWTRQRSLRLLNTFPNKSCVKTPILRHLNRQATEGKAGETISSGANADFASILEGIMGSIKSEDTGLVEMREPESIELSESTAKLEESFDTDLISTKSQNILPDVEPEFGILTTASPPLSPVMYSPGINTEAEKLVKHSENFGKVDEFNDFLDSGYLYDPYSPECFEAEELFPELTF